MAPLEIDASALLHETRLETFKIMFYLRSGVKF